MTPHRTHIQTVHEAHLTGNLAKIRRAWMAWERELWRTNNGPPKGWESRRERLRDVYADWTRCVAEKRDPADLMAVVEKRNRAWARILEVVGEVDLRGPGE